MNFLQVFLLAALPSAIYCTPVPESLDLESRQTYNPELSFVSCTTEHPNCNDNGGTGNVVYENEGCSGVNPITHTAFTYYSKDLAKHGCTAYLYPNLAACTADIGRSMAVGVVGPSTPAKTSMTATQQFTYFAVAGCTCVGC